MIARVIAVQHRSHRIDSNSINVILLKPKTSAVDQKVFYLMATIVEDVGFPVGMKALARIRMLVTTRSVELVQPVVVGRKVSRHPVNQHSNAAVMKMIDEVHEVMRLAKTA